MFGALYDDEDDAYIEEDDTVTSNNTFLVAPEPPRGESMLVGLQNQGATCYLNSLLQALYMTPEFRGGLFGLDPEESLGAAYLDDTSKKHKKARVIPLELQALFTRLKMVDQLAVDTEHLTKKGFRWEGADGAQQHDVQELNRLLFDAVERSLTNTPGEKLIERLYAGSMANQTLCLKCGGISERVEAFHDLMVQVKDKESLLAGLADMVRAETLCGDNQYFCEACDCKVDARKGVKVRSLPPVLVVSLNRFDYDYTTWQRVKLKGAFPFPLLLDMAPYMEGGALDRMGHTVGGGSAGAGAGGAGGAEGEGLAVDAVEVAVGEGGGGGGGGDAEAVDAATAAAIAAATAESKAAADLEACLSGLTAASVWPQQFNSEAGEAEALAASAAAGGGDLVYDLFAVVIHSGDAYHGHYHAYIKDCRGEGVWTAPPSPWHQEEKVYTKDRTPAGSGRGSGGRGGKKGGASGGSGSGSGSSDSFDDPVALLQQILKGQRVHPDTGVPSMVLDKVGQAIKERTGRSYGQLYKKQYGQLKAFLRTHDDSFLFTKNNLVGLLHADTVPDDAAAAASAAEAATEAADVQLFSTQGLTDEELAAMLQQQEEERNTVVGGVGTTAAATAVPGADADGFVTVTRKGGKAGRQQAAAAAAEAEAEATAAAIAAVAAAEAESANADTAAAAAAAAPQSQSERATAQAQQWGRWFDFNDSSVTPMHLGNLPKAFSGRECAYMLVYRSRRLSQGEFPGAAAATDAAADGAADDSTAAAAEAQPAEDGGESKAPPLTRQSTMELQQLQAHPPKFWSDRVRAQNKVLKATREDYEVKSNQLNVYVYTPSRLRLDGPQLVPATSAEEAKAAAKAAAAAGAAAAAVAAAEGKEGQDGEAKAAAKAEEEEEVKEVLEGAVKFTVDIRMTIAELKTLLLEQLRDGDDSLPPSASAAVLHQMKPRGDGYHLYEAVGRATAAAAEGSDAAADADADADATATDAAATDAEEGGEGKGEAVVAVDADMVTVESEDSNLTSGMRLLLWDGATVGGVPVPPGREHEPLTLSFTHLSSRKKKAGSGSGPQQLCVRRSCTLLSLRQRLSELTGIPASQVDVHELVEARKGRMRAKQLVATYSPKQPIPTVDSAGLTCDSELTVEDKKDPGRGGGGRGRARQQQALPLAVRAAQRRENMIELFVSNTAVEGVPGAETSFSFLLPKDTLLGELRDRIVARLGPETTRGIPGGGRLRSVDRGVPDVLYGDLDDSLARVKLKDGDRVVFEAGAPLSSGQVGLEFRVITGNSTEPMGGGGVKSPLQELFAPTDITLMELKRRMLTAAGMEPDTAPLRRLRRTNFLEEAGGLLKKEGDKVSTASLHTGDVLWLEEGSIPLPGQISLKLFLWAPQNWKESEAGQRAAAAVAAAKAAAKAAASGGGDAAVAEAAAGVAAMAVAAADASSADAGSSGDAGSDEAKSSSGSGGKESNLFELCQQGRKACLLPLGDVGVQSAITLEELKVHILTMPSFAEAVGSEARLVGVTTAHLRFRGVHSTYMPGKLYVGEDRSLKKLHVANNKPYVVQLLPEAESLPQHSLLFWCARRNVATKSYKPVYPPTEVVLSHGPRPSYSQLKTALARATAVPNNHMALAKFNQHKQLWKRMPASAAAAQNATARKNGGKGKKKKKGGKQRGGVASVRDPPFGLNHGDFIAVQDSRQDPEGSDDFSSAENDVARAQMAEAKRRKREWMNADGGGGGGYHGPEVNLVLGCDDDFNFDSPSDDSDSEEDTAAAAATGNDDAAATGGLAGGQWECGVCTLHNTAEVLACAVCGSPRA